MKSRAARRVALAATAVLALVGVSASPAQAGTNMPGGARSSCAGSQVSGSPFTKTGPDGTSIKIRLYYSSGSGGTNCVTATKYGPLRGKSTYVSVFVRKSDSTSNAWPNYVYEDGFFKEYAGAVFITGTNGRCVDIGGRFDYKGKAYARDINGIACG